MKMILRLSVAVSMLMIASMAQAALQVQLNVEKWQQPSTTPVIESSTVYTDGDALGGGNTWAGATRKYGGRGVLREIAVSAALSTTVGFDIVFYSRTFTAIATNEAWTAVVGEANESYLTTVTIAASDWTALGSGMSVARKTDIDYVYDLPAGQASIHWQAVMNVGDHAFTTNDLVVTGTLGWIDD